MREPAGRLTGYALGQDHDGEARSFAADVLMVFGDDEKLWCETIAARLAGSIPGPTPTSRKDAVASQLRALEVNVKRVRETGGPARGRARVATGPSSSGLPAATMRSAGPAGRRGQPDRPRPARTPRRPNVRYVPRSR